MASKLHSLLVFFCVFNSGLLKQLPDYFPICKRDQNTIEDCAKKALETLRPHLISGINELDLPGIDPLIIPEIKALTSDDTPIKASGHNIKVTGAGQFTLKSLSVDLDSYKIRVRVLLPKLHFEGGYKLDTQVLVVALKGEGTFKADAVKCDAELVMHGEVIKRDDEEYVHFKKIDTNINIKDYSLQLDGLFNGDKALGEAANQAINQNRGEFLKAAKPFLEKRVSQVALEMANKIVDGFSLQQLLPKP